MHKKASNVHAQHKLSTVCIQRHCVLKKTKMSNLSRKTIYNPITSERATFLQTSNETNGKKTVIEIGPKGKGSPLHFHKDFTEEFEMVKGQMKVKLDKKVITLK